MKNKHSCVQKFWLVPLYKIYRICRGMRHFLCWNLSAFRSWWHWWSCSRRRCLPPLMQFACPPSRQHSSFFLCGFSSAKPIPGIFCHLLLVLSWTRWILRAAVVFPTFFGGLHDWHLPTKQEAALNVVISFLFFLQGPRDKPWILSFWVNFPFN